MLTRRSFLALAGAGIMAPAGLSSYAFAVEPRRLLVTPYHVVPPGFSPEGRPLRIAALADIHACDPWMPVGRIREIVDAANALAPDLVVLLGDYVASIRRLGTTPVAIADWSAELGRLAAPLGVHAVLGNHDWLNDPDAVKAGLRKAGIRVLENEAVLLEPAEGPRFWLAGLGDQWGPLHGPGVDDLPATLTAVGSDPAPVIMMAHEPDIFAKLPGRIGLTLSGHTHGGQVRLPFYGPLIVPSRYGDRYAYGHVVEEGRHLVVSGGLGCTGLPVRFGVPPEIVLLEVGGNPLQVSAFGRAGSAVGFFTA
jgi:predicted MPP superfamily phosphohydrolase